MANSSRKPRKGFPSFFKIVIDPSASHLQLPPAFVRRYLDEIPKKPTLKLETGEHSWQLKIKQIEGNYCFARGWDKVVEDAHLGFGDFLVFWLMDDTTFLASIYGPNGCEKDLSKFTKKCDCDCKRTRGTTSSLPVRTEIKIEDEDEDEDEIEEGEAVKNNSTVKSPEQYPCFQKIICESNSHILRLPREFVVETRIDCKKCIITKDLQGREWPLKLQCEKTTRGSDRYYLSGWQKMKKHNDVVNGDICLFKYIESEGTLVLSQVVKSKAEPRNRESQPQREQRTHVSTPATETAKRKRGRPPKRSPCLVEVKSEDESDPEMVVEVVKRKRGRPRLSRSPKSGNRVVYF